LPLLQPLPLLPLLLLSLLLLSLLLLLLMLMREEINKLPAQHAARKGHAAVRQAGSRP